jgi:ketosteroid isomerase-like protein
MSGENVEIVERAFDAFSTGGVEACLPSFSPDLVVYPFPEWPRASRVSRSRWTAGGVG